MADRKKNARMPEAKAAPAAVQPVEKAAMATEQTPPGTAVAAEQKPRGMAFTEAPAVFESTHASSHMERNFGAARKIEPSERTADLPKMPIVYEKEPRQRKAPEAKKPKMAEAKPVEEAKARIPPEAAIKEAPAAETGQTPADEIDAEAIGTPVHDAPKIVEEKNVADASQSNPPSAAPQPSQPQAQFVRVQTGLLQNDPVRVIEAALFMSGQSLASADLAKLVGIAAVGFVDEKLAALSKEYEEKKSALEIVREDNGKWEMRVRASYAPAVRNFAGESEIPRHALRTLAYISKNNGIKKRDLFNKLGSTIYEDCAELIDKGFVAATPAGRTVSLKTTGKFKQYFEG